MPSPTKDISLIKQRARNGYLNINKNTNGPTLDSINASPSENGLDVS